MEICSEGGFRMSKRETLNAFGYRCPVNWKDDHVGQKKISFTRTWALSPHHRCKGGEDAGIEIKGWIS